MENSELYQLVKDGQEVMGAVNDGLKQQKGILHGIKDALVAVGTSIEKTIKTSEELARQKAELRNLQEGVKEVKNSLRNANCSGHKAQLAALTEKVELNRQADQNQGKNAWQVAILILTVIGTAAVSHLLK